VRATVSERDRETFAVKSSSLVKLQRVVPVIEPRSPEVGDESGFPVGGGVYFPRLGVFVPLFGEVVEPREIVDVKDVGVDREDVGDIKVVRGGQCDCKC
jgi:hypothetical protein